MSNTLNVIEDMLAQINDHKRDKTTLLPHYVQERLNKQVCSYYEQIMDSYNILCHQQNEVKVAKNLVE